ncbi:MAG TPA: hypothetical protein VIQ81_06165 [Gammaproteobacteria bacterium]
MSKHLFSFSKAALIVISVLFLQGCATSALKTAEMRQQLYAGNYQSALAEADRVHQSKPDGVMENLNLGMLLRLSGDYAASNKALETAKRKIDALYATSVSEQGGALLLNDEVISYQGERYEQVLLHLYMALNYLSLQQPDSARVELLQSQVKLNEWGEPKDDVAFMRYFSGILFEMLGEQSDATVAYRKAVDAYKNTQYKYRLDVPLQLKKDLLRSLALMGMDNELAVYKKQFAMNDFMPDKKKQQAEIIVILEKGMVPQREQIVLQTWSSELSSMVRIAVPSYPRPPLHLSNTQLRIAEQQYTTQVVADIDAMARASLEENLPLITARAIARAAIKKKSERNVAENSTAMAQLALMAFNMGSEIADTRGWNTLPQQIELARIALPPGRYQLGFYSPATGSSAYQGEIELKAGEKVIANQRWTKPVLSADSVSGPGRLLIIPIFPLQIFLR